MSTTNRIRFSRYAVLYLLVAILLSGCIKEEGCRSEYTIVVKSLDFNDNDITGTGVVREVVVYIFDDQNRLIDVVSTLEDVLISKDYYPAQEKITVVVWGNGLGSNQLPDVLPGASLADLAATLNKTAATATESSDLFFGKKEIYPTAGAEVNVVPVKRKVASVQVNLRNLREWAGSFDSDYSIVIGYIFDRIGFDGTLHGEKVRVALPALFDAQGRFSSPVFRTFASASEPVTIDVYKGNQKIYSISADDRGVPIRLEEGRLLKIDVGFFSAGGVISIVFAEWDKTDIEEEF